MGAIALEGVSKVFPGGVVAVDDIDLDIGDGEFMVLVGPSGCGKSTALRSIAGLEEITSGTISISPPVISSRPAIMRSSVDLPQPDGPTSTVNSPSAMSTSTPRITWVRPKYFSTLRR